MGVVGRLDQYASMLAGEFDDYSMSENLLLRSNSFNTAGTWTPVSATCVFAQNVTGPDNISNSAWTIDDQSTANDGAGFEQTKSITPSTTTNYCLSIFVKQGTATILDFYAFFIGNSTKGSYLRYTFSTNTISVFSADGGGITPTIYGKVSYPNGWIRIYFVVNDANNGLNNNLLYRIYPASRDAGPIGTTLFYGAQLETGSVATDYTPTTTTAINRVLPATTNTNITGLGTYYSSGFDENVGFTTFLSANVFAPYDLVYDEFGGTLFGAGQGRYMRQNTDKSVIVYNEIDEVSDFRDIVRTGLILDIDMQQPLSYTGRGLTLYDLSGNNNNATAVTTLGVANDAPGTVISLDTSSEIRVDLTANVNKYAFTFSYWGRPTAVPDSNYQGICRLIDTSNPAHGYYFTMDTREVATPSVLHYVKDYATNNWDTRQMISNAEYLNYKWHYYTLVMFAENDWKSYLDGQLLGTNTTPSQDLSSYGNINRVYFGGSSCNFNIANFSMYSTSLTSTQILQNYNALRNRFGL